MARYTTAYLQLLSRKAEVDLLLQMAKGLERSDPIKEASKINALCRGAIVLLCSHLEGYVKALGELTLSRIHEAGVCRSTLSKKISYYASRDLLTEIRNLADTDSVVPKVQAFVRRDLELWKDSGPHPDPISEERFNRTFASPSFKKISSYVGRFGYTDFKHELAKTLKGDCQVCINQIDHLVDIRNKIAHGDKTVSKTPRDILDILPVFMMFCRTMDDLFAEWCKKNICRIR